MTKQEEIRQKLWELLDAFKGKEACDVVGIVLTLLHSQGVVIKEKD